MVIDFHTHVLPARVRENRHRYLARDPSFAAIYGSDKVKIATAEELIASMDRDGVDVSVIASYGWTSPELLAETNDYILESVARYPQRLAGFCAVPLEPAEAAINEIERCARGGARGIGELRLDWQTANFTVTAEQLTPVMETLVRHHLMLMVHVSEPVGHLYPGKGSATPERVYPLITRFPELTVICAHWGGGLPFYALMPEVRENLQNVYFDTAASPFLYQPRIYRQVSQLVGAGKVLFGSDYPLLPPSRYIKEINAADLTVEEKKLILGENARRLLDIRSDP